MKMLALISALMIFFAFALQNAVKDMTYSHSTTQIQKPTATEKAEVNTATLNAFEIAKAKTIAVK